MNKTTAPAPSKKSSFSKFASMFRGSSTGSKANEPASATSQQQAKVPSLSAHSRTSEAPMQTCSSKPSRGIHRKGSNSSNVTSASTRSTSSASSLKRNAPTEVAKLDCKTEIHAEDIRYDLVNTVILSWEHKIKGNNPQWLTVGGEMFLRRLFFRCPETIHMFGFPADTQHDDPSLAQNEMFMAKGKRLIKAIDIAISFLGPDLSHLEETLFELGGRHVQRKCRPYHWPIVGLALFDVFEEILGDKWTPELREQWTIMYNFLGFHMIRGLLHKCPALAEDSKS